MTNHNWLQKFKSTLSKTSHKFSNQIKDIFSSNKIDAASLEKLEEILLASDVGINCTKNIIDELRAFKFSSYEPDLLHKKIADIITRILAPHQSEFQLEKDSLNIIMVCGVNGNGKTTSIGKIASQLKDQGYKVVLAACDTFRAAATEQLKIWGERVGCQVVSGEAGSDPASVAYRAAEEARDFKADVLIIDTAGRLYNQKNLMDELAKVARVIKKFDSTAPHHTLMVLDGTTGQNAYQQLESFKSYVDITGLVVTKLDGTSKAGVVISLSEKFKLPIYFIGVGEQVDDLRKFDAESFATSIVGL